MSQSDLSLPTTGTISGLSYTTTLNAIIAALGSLSSGGSAPSNPIAYQIWFDSTNSILKIRNSANTAWTNFASLSGSNWTPYSGGSVLDITAALEQIHSLTALSAPAAIDDELALYDVSASSPNRRKITSSNLLATTSNLSTVTTKALSNKLLAHDGSVVGTLTPQQIFDLITSITAKTSPTGSDKIAIYDAAASVAKSATLANVFAAVGGLTAESSPSTSDYLLLNKSGGGARSVLISALSGLFGGTVDFQTFTGSGTWTKPSTGTVTIILVWSAGGGGARGSNKGGGAGGGFSFRIIAKSSLGSTETVTVGAAGVGKTSTNGDGGDGGNSSFGSWLTVYGGKGGKTSTSNTGSDYAGGGNAISAQTTPPFFEASTIATLKDNTGSSSNIVGAYPSQHGVFFGGAGGSGNGGSSAFGGGAGGTGAGTGGTSQWGGAGGAGSSSGTGSTGSAPAGGGGGGNTAGGNGARGEIWVITI